jgi:hypothetical protein
LTETSLAVAQAAKGNYLYPKDNPQQLVSFHAGSQAMGNVLNVNGLMQSKKRTCITIMRLYHGILLRHNLPFNCAGVQLHHTLLSLLPIHLQAEIDSWVDVAAAVERAAASWVQPTSQQATDEVHHQQQRQQGQVGYYETLISTSGWTFSLL